MSFVLFVHMGCRCSKSVSERRFDGYKLLRLTFIEL